MENMQRVLSAGKHATGSKRGEKNRGKKAEKQSYDLISILIS